MAARVGGSGPARLQVPFHPRVRADPDAAAVLFTMQAAGANKLAGLRQLRDETRDLRRALEAAPGVAGR
jgi:hypothetical protein